MQASILKVGRVEWRDDNGVKSPVVRDWHMDAEGKDIPLIARGDSGVKVCGWSIPELEAIAIAAEAWQR